MVKSVTFLQRLEDITHHDRLLHSMHKHCKWSCINVDLPEGRTVHVTQSILPFILTNKQLVCTVTEINVAKTWWKTAFKKSTGKSGTCMLGLSQRCGVTQNFSYCIMWILKIYIKQPWNQTPLRGKEMHLCKQYSPMQSCIWIYVSAVDSAC